MKGETMMVLDMPCLKGDFLVCKNKDIPLIKLPRDCIIRRNIIKDYDFKYGKINGVESLLAQSKISDETIELLPAYKARSKIYYKKRKIDIVIRSAFDDADYSIGNSIIESNHYLNPPDKGMMLLAEIESEKDHKYLLEKLNQNCEVNEFNKMLSKCSKIVGCAIINQLTYASPKGRIKIAEELKIEEMLKTGKDANGNKLSRMNVLELMKISWASRFAVIEQFHNLGIGTLLAEHAGIVSNSKIIPSSDYIEVFTTHIKKTAQNIKDAKINSFLDKAGYIVYDELLKSKPFYNKKEERFVTYKKLYFYKKVGV